MLGEIVGKAIGAAVPMDNVLALGNAVLDPVEMHVHGTGAALLDSVVEDASGAGIVSLDWSGRLGMAHFSESGAERGCIFRGVEKGAVFGFGGGRENGIHDGAMYMDGAIEWRGCAVGIRGNESGSISGWFVAEKEEAAGTGASLAFREVGGIAVYVQMHVAGVVSNGCVGMSGTIVEELRDGKGGDFGAL